MKRPLLLTALVVLSFGCSSSKSSPGDGGGTGGKTTGSGGASATGGSSSATGGAGGTASDTSQSVLERNKHPNRDGSFLQPTLTKAAAATMAADTTFDTGATFTGDVYASPLYMQNGPNGKGAFFTVTDSNNVIALDETTGATIWTKSLGSAPSKTGVSCGFINPIGAISTPVIDATARVIYVAGATGTTAITDHQIHALSVDDGSEKTGWPVSALQAKSGSLTFTPAPQNQRSSLSLVNGTLYVAYGGHDGDCGPYHGWVIGIDTSDPAMMGAWATAGQGEGIWAAGGMASDGTGVFALTSNSTVGATTHMDSEEAVRITGLGTLSDSFYSSDWQGMDKADADLGASSPVYIEVPGATPSKILVAISKNGHMYLLDAAHLGGMGGQKVDFQVAGAAGNESMLIHTVPGSYSTSQGVHVVFSTDASGNCPTTGPGGAVVMSVLIPPGAPPKPQVVWCASAAGTPGPISTTTDGTNNVVVWFMNNKKLTGVDGDTGATVFTGTDSCNVQHWTSPIAVNGRIVAAAGGSLCSWSPH